MSNKFYIREGTPNGDYNASTKARQDIATILESLGFEPFCIDTKYGISTSPIGKIKQISTYNKNSHIWEKAIRALPPNSTIVIQHPLLNTTLSLNETFHYLKQQNIRTILLIHDLESIRYPSKQGTPYFRRIQREDSLMLNAADIIIAHNSKMQEKIIDAFHISPEKIYTVGLFDYLLEPAFAINKKASKSAPIAIAGNLSTDKATYLKSLSNIEDTTFYLFGKGEPMPKFSENTIYKGAFLPGQPSEELAECSFGLIWDGSSTKSLAGDTGQYLKYNNPHKASLYLSVGLPLIVQNDSALADFVVSNKIGITVCSLTDIPKAINTLSSQKYTALRKNVVAFSKKLHSGYFLKNVLHEIISHND